MHPTRNLLFFLFVALGASAAGAAEEPALTDVFVSGTEGYHTYRIPSVICTQRGTLLAFCEGRKSSNADQSPTDMMLRRSLDGGKTWTPMRVLVPGVPHAMMDPCPVEDRTTGRLFLVYDRWPYRQPGTESAPRRPGLGLDSITAWVMATDDDGQTWSEPLDITATTKKPAWAGMAHGPGVGIQTRAGRLVIPCNHYENGRRCFVIYSDDHGRTWRLGGEAGPRMSESQVVELADGRLMLNMRSYRGKHCRAAAFSSDGGLTWSEVVDVPELVEPVCQGSLLRYGEPGYQGKNRLLFCNPADPKQRVRLTVRLSEDDGKTWPISKTLYEGSSAYCCLTVLPDGTIGCLFERDSYRKITFARWTLDWLTGGAKR